MLLGRGRHDDAVERRLLGPARIAIAGADVNVRPVQRPQHRLGTARQLGDDLHRVDLTNELAQDGGLISRARADFEHLVRRRNLQAPRSCRRRCRAARSSGPTRSAAVHRRRPGGASSGGTKRSRGTERIASSTRASVTPRCRICCSTISCRRARRSDSLFCAAVMHPTSTVHATMHGTSGHDIQS